MSYEAPPEAEELHLLGKLLPAPIRVRHSATLAIGRRLDAAGDGMLITMVGESPWLEITAQGRRRLMEQGPQPKPCPFCAAPLVKSAFGSTWGHHLGSRCILADYATSKIDLWNTRVATPSLSTD